jgi:hypothetical protein
MPSSRHKLGASVPDSAYFKILMFKLSEYLDIFKKNSLTGLCDFLILNSIILHEDYLLILY